MSGDRDRRDDWGAPLLPWESSPNNRPFTKDTETVSTPDRVLLYDHLGRPLMRKRRAFGFRPEDAK